MAHYFIHHQLWREHSPDAYHPPIAHGDNIVVAAARS
jgi:hypothetical protein